MKIIQYSTQHKKKWDDFIQSARNGHFLSYRNYMEYHSERFEDHSLLFFDDKDQLIALLPANIKDETLYSHQGLTFGGFIVNPKMKVEAMQVIFLTLIEYLNSINVKRLIYKTMPSIYSDALAQEDLYALFIFGAKLYRRDVSSTIDLQLPFKYSKGRKWTVNKAKKEDLELCQMTDFTLFWQLLSNVLDSQHGAKPVHTLKEIEYLHTHFPRNIKLFVAKKGDQVIAGTVIYETEHVAHTQYLANSDEGRDLGALDLLIDYLIKDVYKNKKYFDFGISTENEGLDLNKGLISQKEGFGAKAIVQDFYEVEIK